MIFICKVFNKDLNKVSEQSDNLWMLSMDIAQGENQNVHSWTASCNKSNE